MENVNLIFAWFWLAAFWAGVLLELSLHLSDMGQGGQSEQRLIGIGESAIV